MANFFKKCKRKFELFEKKIEILSCFDLTDFYIIFIALQRKFWKKKLVKLMLSNFSNFNCWKNPKFYLHFLHNLAISGPGKCKIWNLGIKISKIIKFELIEMKGFKVLIFPILTSKCIETCLVKLSTVVWQTDGRTILHREGQTDVKSEIIIYYLNVYH